MQLDVIIMMYNCTKTLPRALDSLMEQTNKDFNLIFVDDGSVDNPYEIIDKYKDKFKVRYIKHEKNLGVTMARQSGIDAATEYFTFLDADDVLLPNAIEVFRKEIEVSNPDVIVSPTLYYTDRPQASRLPVNMVSCHGKVYNKELIKRYNISLHESITCCEDTFLNWLALELADRVVVINDLTYMQIYTEGSVTTTTRWRREEHRDLSRARMIALRHLYKHTKAIKNGFQSVRNSLLQVINNEKENHNNIINNIKI